MHVIAPRNVLIPILDRCLGSADPKAALPVCANLHLSAKDGKLSVVGTNLTLSTSASVEVRVERHGSIALPAKDLYDRVKAMPVGDVRIEEGPGSQGLIAAVGHPRRFTVHGIPGGEFPKVATPPADATWVEISAKTLGWLLNATSYGMSSDPTRPHIHATLIELEGRVLRMVTTDGHRLARAEAKLPAPLKLGAESNALLVSAEAITQIKKLVADADATVRIACEDNRTLFVEVGGFGFATKLVDTQFPPYRQVIPQAQKRTALVDRNVLLDLLNAMAISTDDAVVAVTVKPGVIAVGAVCKKDAKGEAYDEICAEYNGPEITVGMNAKLLGDGLRVMPEGLVELQVTGELDPVLSVPVTLADGENLLALTMPARIDGSQTKGA